MSDFIYQCPTVPTISGSEVRFSVDTRRVVPIFHWPLQYVSCGEITPDQPRVQWGVSTHGARYDSFGGLRLGNARNNLTLGSRTSYVSSGSSLATLERQRVGVATLTMGGRVRFKYWNDHAFWWWPVGDGGDQGDTAGVQLSYNLAPHQLSAGDWKFQNLSLTMRLASGVPTRSSAVPMGDGQVYTEVRFPEVDRGDVSVGTSLTQGKSRRLDVGFTVNSGRIRHAVQSDLVHRSLGIPEFPRTCNVEVMLYMRVVGF